MGGKDDLGSQGLRMGGMENQTLRVKTVEDAGLRNSDRIN
jgi:hypothetical protein